MKANSIRRLDGQGRVILPSHIRKRLNLAKNSAVTIDMTEDGVILIKPAEKRCAICGEIIKDEELFAPINFTMAGEKYICSCCALDIREKNGVWGR